MDTPLLGFTAAIVVFIVMASIFEWVREAEHNKRFPLISDEEFIRRCGPGTNPEIAIKNRRIIAMQLNVEYDRIHPSSRFVEDLHAD